MANILHISDTHHRIDMLDDILSAARFLSEKFGHPMPDLVAVTGDVMGSGFDAHELEAFIRFLDGWKDLGVPVAFVPGNHDRPFQAAHLVVSAKCFGLKEREINSLLTLADAVRERCHVLTNNSAIINGIKVHGFAWQPPFCDWAFNLDDERRKHEMSLIHPEVEVLLFHSPPAGILDTGARGVSAGDPLINDALEDASLGVPHPAHTILFGHIHEQGERNAFRKVGGKWRFFRNGSLVDERYAPRSHFKALREMIGGDPVKFLPGIEAWNRMLVSTDGPQADMDRWVREVIEDAAQDESYADGAWVLEEDFNEPLDRLAAFAQTVSFDHQNNRYDSGAISWRASMIRLLADAGYAEIEKEVGRVVVAKPVDW